MTPSSDSRRPSEGEFEELLALMADERLASDQAQRLGELVAGDEEMRRRYLEAATLGAALEWAHGAATSAPAQVDELVVADRSAADLVVGGLAPPVDSRPMVFNRGVSRSAVAFTAGATAVGILVAALGVLRSPGADPNLDSGPSPLVNNETPERAVVATLTGLVDCKWADPKRAATYGEHLYAGRQLKIDSGLAQLTFESGAQLILQGPVKFELRSDMEADLGRGKLAAVVPQQAHGFSVRTPTAEIVDLGTEFGLEVDETGATDVHVFQGEVLSWQVNLMGDVEGDALSLTGDEAASYSPTGISTQKRADASRFVRTVAPRISEKSLPRLPVKRNLVLWLAADVLVKKDSLGRVVAWQDILVGDNQLEDDAMQHYEEARPMWEADGIAGKPALRFDGELSYLVTTPFFSTPDQTVFVVFSRGSREEKPGNRCPLINYNGPPGDMSRSATQFRILQIGDYLTPGAYFGMVYAQLGERSTHFGTIQTLKPVVDDQPAVLAYVYDPSGNHAQLWLDGESQGETTAHTGMEFASRKIIGKHPKEPGYFRGRMAELIIFNDALTTDEVEQINQYLLSKYSFSR
ncbi:FecR protein [Pirellulimonas nuda]|uniref:FecR protein n=1 Tax=Pirellulimonas nuda TaxID=2528009 RepID=A0A518DAR6_9BACT|nr:LamG-like jellyroll fold domain-containing protein [Pirellulimonas nuda]QDU88543.1 FecR protein [Pirellulimonas nuda]